MEEALAIIETNREYIDNFIYFIVGFYIIPIACSYIFVFFFPIKFNTISI